MTTPAPAPESGARSSPFRSSEAIVIFIILCLLAATIRPVATEPGSSLGLFAAPIHFLTDLLLGWFLFPSRTLPQIKPDIDGIAVFFFTAAILTFAAHRFLAWLYPLRRNPDSSSPPQWKTGWSALLLAGAILLFTLTVSVSGIYHTLAWFSAPPRPVIQSRIPLFDPDYAFHDTAGILQEAIKTYNQNHAKEDRFQEFMLHKASTLQSHHQLMETGYFTRPDGSIYAAFVIPRDPVDRARLGIAIIGISKYSTYNESEFLKPGQSNVCTPQQILANWPALLQTLQSESSAEP
jgi:hypothetical protein